MLITFLFVLSNGDLCVCGGEALILIVLISDLNILTVLHQLFKKLELLSIKAIQENEKLEA